MRVIAALLNTSYRQEIEYKKKSGCAKSEKFFEEAMLFPDPGYQGGHALMIIAFEFIATCWKSMRSGDRARKWKSVQEIRRKYI